MYNHSDKSQVEYSLTQLTGGLFYHLKYKKIEDITVTDICNRAKITRRTFYRNCENKTDLILYGTDRLVLEQIRKTDFSSTDYRKMYQSFFAFWGEHRRFLSILDQNNLFDLFLHEFIEVCGTYMRYPLQEETIHGSDDKEQTRLYSNAFIIGGLGLMLRHWVRNSFLPDPEELADTISFLIPKP
ncbi:MAG: TetR/AcrR family transcriptional regulator [Lachnospiraceae bacterium]|nr:TetR/AcrR family transcriptional regulator [Lachnospiraceae bacterium]